MSWKIIWQALKREEMRKKIGVVTFLIVIYRALSHVPVPLTDDPAQLRQVLDSLLSSQDLLGFFDLFSGGALSNFSIVLVGLGPYITASIVLQLLTKVVPKLEEISKDGQAGQRRINQLTRYVTAPLAIVQSVGLVLLIRTQASQVSGIDIAQGASMFDWILIVGALVGGAMLLMWIGELMTEQGVGNGISLLIFAGIISQLPGVLTTLSNTVVASIRDTTSYGIYDWFSIPFNPVGVAIIAAFVAAFVLVTYWVVKLSEAQRIITVSYAKRVQGNRAYGGVDTVLPIKLIIAGVIPVIFAFAFILIPSFMGQILINMDNPTLANIGETLNNMFLGITQGTNIVRVGILQFAAPLVFLFGLVVAFTYFYTGFVFNAKDISENLQNQGGFIAGIRPGEQTEKYLSSIVNKLNFIGSISLGTLVVLPFIVQYFLRTDSLTLGGSGLLIVVSVAIETLRQIESKAMMITYDEGEE